MIRRILWVLAGLLWGAITFLVGLYATFPQEAARNRLEYEVSERTNDEYAMSVVSLSLWRLSGVDLDDVQVFTVKKGRKTKENPKPALQRTPLVRFDSLGLRLAPIKALLGTQAVAFDAEIYDGDIEGTWSKGESLYALDFEADGVDLSRMPVGGVDNPIHLLGKLEGEGDITLDTADVKSSAGTLRLSFPGLGIGPGSTVGGFTLPEVVFEKAVLAFEAKEGKLEVTEGTFESPTLDATVTGDITLNKKLARSRYRLEIVFTLPEDLDQLAQLAGDLKRARDSEGNYHYLVTGTIFQPSARPSRASATKSAKASLKDRGDGPLATGVREVDAEDVGGDASEEDKRRAREERIRERRERLRKRREERAARDGEREPGPSAREDLDRDLDEPDFREPDDEDFPPGPEDPMPGDFPPIPPEFDGPPPDEGPPPE